MSHFLVYWKTFSIDVADVKTFCEKTHKWQSDSEWLYQAVQKGDTIWSVVRAQPPFSFRWGLIQQSFVSQPPKHNRNPPNQGYKYLFECDQDKSRRFNPAFQADIQGLLKKLTFENSNPISLTGAKIGMALQHPRKLSDPDVILLESFVSTLKSLQPTDRFSPF